MKPHRLAILTTHPIQYQAPLWQAMVRDGRIEPMVFFERDLGVKGAAYDPEFGKEIRWDIPLLEGYNHVFLAGPFHLAKLIFLGGFDALLVHGWNSPLTWFAIFTAKLRGVRVFMRAESPWKQEVLKPKWKRAVKHALLRPLFALIKAFLCIGEENHRFYLAYGVPARKLFAVPYAVDNGRFMARADDLLSKKGEIRGNLGIAGSAFTVLFVGKFIPKKRPMDLLKAYALAGIPEKALILVGEGEFKYILQEYAGEKSLPNVIFPGFKNQTELPEYYAAADVFVLPSGEGETWGLVVNEAMCFGLPVILSDMVGSSADLVRPGENGFTIPLGDIGALARAMETIAQGDAEGFRAASRRIVGQYSYARDIDGIVAALEERVMHQEG